MDFETAVNRMPTALQRSYDPLNHTSVRDLAYLTAHELDLYAEGEESDIRTPREAREAHEYLKALAAVIGGVTNA